MASYKLSVVVPVMNEEENIKPLYKAVDSALSDLNYQLIFIDDGSIDSTIEEIKKLKQKAKHIKLIQFTRNYGQTSALAAGIEYSDGEFIATIDGDLQNDPKDILPMLKKLEKEKLDIVLGIRKKRQDNLFIRKIPSKIANWLIRKFTKVSVTDLGCTLKVFKASLAKKLDLYGELHRFIPIIASMHGAKIREVEVSHHSRKFGVTKYGIDRTVRVLSDLFLMIFFLRYRQRPMHLFGSIGLILMFISFVLSTYLGFLKLMGHDIGHRPLFFIDILAIIMSLQFITTGFIAELLMRTYYAADNKKPYNILAIE
jgi:glycosyltransferase involved in cell wall biosynthesis